MIRALILAAAATAVTQTSGPLARDVVGSNGTTQLSITAPAFGDRQPIPTPYGQDGENFSPALSWSGVPSGTLSLALLVEDPDASAPKPYLHWSLYNIPPDVSTIPESIPGQPQLPMLKRARQGRNSKGTIGYIGPRPPAGDPPHHYHFQVFALDAMLDVPPGSTRDALLTAMGGHVVARGEVVGTFKR